LGFWGCEVWGKDIAVVSSACGVRRKRRQEQQTEKKQEKGETIEGLIASQRGKRIWGRWCVGGDLGFSRQRLGGAVGKKEGPTEACGWGGEMGFSLQLAS